ncbi:MAG: cupin domain-containing protein [Calditrichia bacterium]
MERTADEWINLLRLSKHPEGGYFKEVYRSDGGVEMSALPKRYGMRGRRSFCTSIYYLLKSEEFSALHRLRSDETWHFYAGSPLKISILSAAGVHSEVFLGNDPLNNQNLQAVIPHNHWFGAKVIQTGGFTLAGCTVSPGFDFKDFEMGERGKLLKRFPDHATLIEALTHEPE